MANQADTGSTATAQVAALTRHVATLDAQNGDLTVQVARLTAVVAARDGIIKELKEAEPKATSINTDLPADTARKRLRNS
ncbi:hypothetical protein [uncultured Sulfitobacter sp.]|uniref:hypothetical protein n=1 Tax=uncultured Sulfitobacter sp. TaxID=191468 RepID=UPI0026248937|nr:hypothetical protein [uncultured Sulfitobacter sp.]